MHALTEIENSPLHSSPIPNAEKVSTPLQDEESFKGFDAGLQTNADRIKCLRADLQNLRSRKKNMDQIKQNLLNIHAKVNTINRIRSKNLARRSIESDRITAGPTDTPAMVHPRTRRQFRKENENIDEYLPKNVNIRLFK